MTEGASLAKWHGEIVLEARKAFAEEVIKCLFDDDEQAWDTCVTAIRSLAAPSTAKDSE